MGCKMPTDRGTPAGNVASTKAANSKPYSAAALRSVCIVARPV